jgi:DNA-binding NarL/FixJ family response regulator
MHTSFDEERQPVRLSPEGTPRGYVDHALAPTVLIVDDHPSFRAMARFVLEAEGYEIVGDAANGESGVAEAIRLNPDIVLLDIGLPDIDGFDVVSRIRDAGVDSAIVLTSTRDASDYGPLLTESGAEGFIAKSDLSGDALRALVA